MQLVDAGEFSELASTECVHGHLTLHNDRNDKKEKCSELFLIKMILYYWNGKHSFIICVDLGEET